MIQIITTIIASGCTLIGVVLTVMATSRKSATVVETKLAVMENRIDELTREVREHNNFAKRMPVLEEKVERLEKKEG